VVQGASPYPDSRRLHATNTRRGSWHNSVSVTDGERRFGSRPRLPSHLFPIPAFPRPGEVLGNSTARLTGGTLGNSAGVPVPPTIFKFPSDDDHPDDANESQKSVHANRERASAAATGSVTRSQDNAKGCRR